jgi:predicted ferric reductase
VRLSRSANARLTSTADRGVHQTEKGPLEHGHALTMTSQLTWYVARSAGIVSWALLTASVVWGLAMTTRIARGHVRTAWLVALHRYLGGLAAIFVGVHVAAILLDDYVHFDLASVLVPFASNWRPGAVAWGVVALYVLLAVELTSLARARLSKPVWRAVHYASFPLFVLATVHGLTAGTDAHTALFRWIAVLAIGAVSALIAIRVAGDTKPEPARIPARVPQRQTRLRIPAERIEEQRWTTSVTTPSPWAPPTNAVGPTPAPPPRGAPTR